MSNEVYLSGKTPLPKEDGRIKPGYYKYIPEWLNREIVIDIYPGFVYWAYGYGDDCGNAVTEDMLDRITFFKPYVTSEQ